MFCATAWIQREYCSPDEQAETNLCSAAPGSPEAAAALLDAKHRLASQVQNLRVRTRLQVSKAIYFWHLHQVFALPTG